MLTEIYCDKFKSGGADGETRAPIKFNNGLNAIIGDEDRSNSIGKSTLLMIIDFVFGGEDYLTKCDAVHKYIGNHTIYFTLKFGEELYYFGRNNQDSKRIIVCDSSYNLKEDEEPIPITDYRKFLLEKNGLNYENLSWRGVISSHIRIHNRDTMDSSKPLSSARNGKNEQDIKVLLQLYHRYSRVKELMDKAALAEDERDTFKNSISHNFIKAVKNKTEYNHNVIKIEELEKKQKELASDSNKGLLNLTDIQTERLSELDKESVEVYRQFASIRSQLNNLRRDKLNEKTSVKSNYKELQKFFPDVELKEIERIDEFHKGLTKILNNEYTDKERELETIYIALNNEILRIKEEIQKIKNVPNVTQAILNEYARLTTELNNARSANEHFNELNELKENAKNAVQERDEAIKTELDEISNLFNTEMRTITNRIVNNDSTVPPILELNKMSSYRFVTKGDDGSGTADRGLITFDLATLRTSNIPFLIHDADLMDPISKPMLTGIIKEYDSLKDLNKQAFLTFRSYEFYDENVTPLLNDNEVIRLGANGNELFGWSWNKEDKN